jgi:Flp pilus assembly secretin CpaC
MSPLVLVALVVLHADPAEDAPVRVSPGMQQVLKIPGLQRVALGNEAIADVTTTASGELLVLGKKEGRTNLTLWIRGKAKPITRTIVVDSGKFAELEKLVKEKVDSTLKTEVFGDKLVIDGTLDSVEDFRKLKLLVADYQNVKLLVRLSPGAINVVVAQINAELKKQGITTATAKVLGNRIVLEGGVADAEERNKAQMIADSFYADFSNK